MTVIIYTKPDCPYCAAAKQDLEARGDAYEEIDITVTPDAEDDIAALTGGPVIVPVVVDGADVRFGFGGT
jgi:glutaredoxin 3